MKYFWFQDLASKEEFFVMAEGVSKAWDVVLEYFTSENAQIYCLGQVDDNFAEMSGYDIY